MTKKFDPTKPVQTRDGRKARIVATDMKQAGYSILALVTLSNSEEQAETFTADGAYYKHPGARAEFDLVNVPEKIVRYVNVYRDSMGWAVNSSAAEAAQVALEDGFRPIACIRVEFEEGRFDE